MSAMAKTAILALLITSIAGATDITGTWAVKGDVSGYAIELTCDFTQKASDLSGTCKGGGRPDRTITGKVDDKAVQFEYNVDYDGNNVHAVYKGTLQSDSSMSGSVDVMGNSGTFSATKK
jgi:hypothetical protein